MAVGASDDVDGNLANLSNVSTAHYSSRGTIATALEGGTVYSTIVDIVAPGTAHGFPCSGTAGNEQYFMGAKSGTSISAPIVAGIAALLRDWSVTRGGLPGNLTDDPYAWRVLLSAMGDGAGETSTSGPMYDSTNRATGFGKLRYVDLDREIGSGAWGVQRRVLVPGQMVDWSVGGTGPESSSVQGWKFAALIDRNRYGDTPRVYFYLIDKCPAGGGEIAMSYWFSTGHKARKRMASWDMVSQFRNRCLWLRAWLPVTATENVELYTADYFYTNDRINHEQN